MPGRVPDSSGRLLPARLPAGPATPAPRATPRLPRPEARGGGWQDSLPLILFGLTCLGLAVYSYLLHAGAWGGRVPLWTYLAGLGGIALAGGIASAAVGEDLDSLPSAGDRLGGDLIVVPYSEWTALREAAGRAAAGRGLTTTPPAPASVSRVPASPAARPRPAAGAVATPAVPSRPPVTVPGRPAETPPEWWEAALRAAQEDGLLEGKTKRSSIGAEPAEYREVLETLDSIESQSATTGSKSLPRSRSRGSGEPAAGPREPTLAPPVAPSPPANITAQRPSKADEELDALTQELEALRPPISPMAAKTSAPSRVQDPCAGCGVPLSAPGPRDRCESCGRPQCRSCLERARSEGHHSRCPVCAMLLDEADR